MILDRVEVVAVEGADRGRQREQTTRIEPLREVVLRGVILEHRVGDVGNQLLHIAQILGATDEGAVRWVLEYEIAKGKFALDIVGQLLVQRLRSLVDESHTKLLCVSLETLLGRLQQNGHQRIVVANQAAEVDACVLLLVRRTIGRVERKSDVRDDTQQVVFVALVDPHGVLVVGCQQDLRTGTLTQNLLLLVVGIFQELTILQQHKFVDRGQVGRVVADRVLDQQNRLHATLQNILVGIHSVLDELDDGDDQVGIAVPAEDVVESRAILLLDTAIDILREAGQQHHGHLRIALLDDAREGKHVGLTHVVHRQNEVETTLRLQSLQRLRGRTDARQRGRVAHIEVHILLVDLRFDAAVLFEDIAVVAATYEQDFVDSVAHKSERHVARLATRGRINCVVHHINSRLCRQK